MMNRKELKEKISEISNSEFPLIDFFNDIDWLDDKRFDTEKAYEDIEKIYNVFVHYIDKSKQLEMENQELRKKLDGIPLEYDGYLYFTKSISNVVKENKKLKKAFDILKDKLDIKLEVYHSGGCTLNHKIIPNCVIPNERCLRYLEVEEYELLKSVLEEE